VIKSISFIVLTWINSMNLKF